MSQIGNFELIKNFDAYGEYPTFQYKSRLSGLSLFFSYLENPTIECQFCLATETLNDDGVAYALQKLIFSGSRQYPYKNLLDLLAKRTLTCDIWAYTNTTHTTYRLSTLNKDDLLVFLPIYLDHILNPLLTEAAFITEIHHVTPEGKDGGEVFCELKDDEDLQTMIDRRFLKNIYPNCGYSSQKHGSPWKLRELNIEKIREFHQKFYRLENLTILITGPVQEHEEILKILTGLKNGFVRGEFEKPWQKPVPPLLKSSDLAVEFPVKDATNGAFMIGWRGPNFVNQQYLYKAVHILFKYFFNYIFPGEFLEGDDSYSNYVGFDYIENLESCFYVIALDVPLTKLTKFKPKLFEIFENIVNNSIDLEIIKNTIESEKRSIITELQYSPNSTISSAIIEHVLYANNLQEHLNPFIDYDRLLNESKTFWTNLIEEYLLKSNYVAIQGIPNSTKYDEFMKQEDALIRQRLEHLGEDGLEIIAEKLEKSLKLNHEPNDDCLELIKIGEFNPKFYTIERYQSDSCETLGNMPIFTYFDYIKSELVYVYTFLNTDIINEERRRYLPLIVKSIFNSPLIENNEIIPKEVFIGELSNDTNSYRANFGVTSKFCNIISIRFEVEVKKFKQIIRHLRNLLFGLKFVEDNLKSIVDDLKIDIIDRKQSSQTILESVKNQLIYESHCNIFNDNIHRQYQFLTNLTNFDEVVLVCREIWNNLVQSDNMMVHIVGGLNIDEFEENFRGFLPENHQKNRKLWKPTPDGSFITNFHEESRLYAVKISGLDYNNFQIFKYLGSELTHNPALLVYLKYLTETNDHLFELKLNYGLLSLNFKNKPIITDTYLEIKSLITDQIRNKIWDKKLIQSTKRSLIMDLCDKEIYISDFTVELILSNFENIDYTYNRRLINSIINVTIDDLNRVGDQYLLHLFDDTNLAVIITDPDTNLEDFKRFGFKIEEYPWLI